MKLKSCLLTVLLAWAATTAAQAQQISYQSGNESLTFNVTLTQPGVINLIGVGCSTWGTTPELYITLGTDHRVTFRGVYSKEGPSALNNTDSSLVSYNYCSATLAPGTYTVQISGNVGIAQNYVTVILPGEPPSGMQQVITQITQDYQSADTQLQAALESQINGLTSSVQSSLGSMAAQITTLQGQIADLQSSQGSQDSEITQLQSQLSALSGQYNDLLAQDQALALRVTALENKPAASSGSSGAKGSNGKSFGSNWYDYAILAGVPTVISVGSNLLWPKTEVINEDNTVHGTENEARPGF